MKRVALVGEPDANGFAKARFWHFHDAIAAAGHEVIVVDAGGRGAEGRGGDASGAHTTADVVVSAGAYRPTDAAIRVCGERPVWIDLPGDPYADAQAVVARGGDGARVAEDCARVFLPALARADAFSTIGMASRFSLIGQLGLLGRWAGPDRLPIAPIPIAWPQPPHIKTDDVNIHTYEKRRRRFSYVGTGAEGPVRVLLAGSFNTWFDDDAVGDVLIEAMRRTPVEVDVTGGPGQPGGYERFRERFSAYANVRFHGWLADPQPVLSQCEVLLTLDRSDVWEPLTGSRTRVLAARAAGLRVVASSGPELIDELAREGQVRAVQSREEAVVSLLDRTPAPDPAPIARRYDAKRLAEPLLAWIANPTRAPSAAASAPLEHANRARERAEAELAAIRGTWAFRLGGRRR